MSNDFFKDFSWDYDPRQDPYAKRAKGFDEELIKRHTEVIFFGQLKEALVGVVEHAERPPIACYSIDMVLNIFKEKHGLGDDEAQVALDQLINSDLGPSSPCFLDSSIVEP